MGKKGELERAQWFHASGRLAEAEALYREVLRVHPDEVEAMEGLGVVSLHLGRPDEARALFARGLAIVPNSACLHANLGEVLRMLRRSDEAADEVQEGARAWIRAWLNPGTYSVTWRKIERTIATPWRPIGRPFDSSLGSFPATSTWGSCSWRCAFAPRPPRPCAALRIEPDNVLALTKLGQALWELRDPDLVDEAEMHCRRALALGAAASRGTREPRPGASPPGAVRRGARVLQAGVGAGHP